ncbi:MAG: hypothetical protein HQ522_19280 [Bacteroidetes bacterium]|nr:hypothetical protein [Bacteroidota bacterium]
MKTEIVVTDNFQKKAKKFLKKYKSLKAELNQLYYTLLEHPNSGTPLGNNSFKIRLGVKSKGKGESGGLRIITYLEIDFLLDEETSKVYLLSIYDKSEIESISRNEIQQIISKIKD